MLAFVSCCISPKTNESSQDLVVGHSIEWPSLYSSLNYHLINTNCFTLNQFNFKCMKQLFILNISPSDSALHCYFTVSRMPSSCGLGQTQKHCGVSSVLNQSLAFPSQVLYILILLILAITAFSFHKLFFFWVLKLTYQDKHNWTYIDRYPFKQQSHCTNILLTPFEITFKK